MLLGFFKPNGSEKEEEGTTNSTWTSRTTIQTVSVCGKGRGRCGGTCGFRRHIQTPEIKN